MSTFSHFRRNVYSQNGEDGVVEEICRRLSLEGGSFVELGAWDARYLSNTRLLLEKGWSGVFIEGDPAKFVRLEKEMLPFEERVVAVNAWVEKSGEHSLDRILATTRIKPRFEVLSIDIDSWDWHIWQSLELYSPLIVLIEINSAIPVGIWQTHRDGRVAGSSFTATVDLGRHKGYRAVCHTGNVIFVHETFIDRLGLPTTEVDFPELLFDYNWMSFQYVDRRASLLKRLWRTHKGNSKVTTCASERLDADW